MKLIVVTGPESSGKTTLVRDLSKYFGTGSVEEYARWYLEKLPRPYEFRDLLAICSGQEIEMLERRAESKGRFLFLDTWAIVLMIWSEYRFNKSHICFSALLDRYEIDHFLLCSPDIPWSPDALRENPEDRNELFQLYKTRLQDLGLSSSILSGDREEKLRLAKGILDSPD